ncbi:hypothetical protein GH714_040336 [Hevea brasiliensis]|uniref:Terpene synthase N-terminal domain-containing protein n=1 Tax=Hevea brasiliensis TaxID=3981 RepID=A0A6A6MTP4_HEVBR|nr:hypothetical protein GH714_040336 [Hevea brasiliensis]
MTTQRKNICVNESYDCNLEEWLIKLDTVQLVQGMITFVIEFHDKNGIHSYLHNDKNFLLKFGMKCYLGAHVRNIVKVFIVHDDKSEKKNVDLKEKSKNADMTELASIFVIPYLLGALAELETMSLLHDTNGLEVGISDATFSLLCRAVLVLLSLNHYIVHPLNCSLDISYHFESEIDEILIEMSSESDDDNNDLYAIALKFWPVRKQGYNMSCDVFNKFKDSQGNVKDSLVNDHRGMLSMYEAMHLRVHGEDILDEALAFTTAHLEPLVT